VLDVNETAARMFGATRQELITMDFRRMTVEKIDDSSEEALGRLRQAAVEGPQVFEWQSRRVDDGRVFSTEVSLRLEKMNNQEVVLASVRDISLRKKVQQDKEALENQMRQAQKLESLGLMAGGVAHDFNNLLTVILGNASLAKRDLAPDSASVSALDKITTAVQRAAALCQQLLAYSGKSVFLIEHYDLNDIVKDLTGMMEVSIPKKVRLNLQLVSPLPPILADATQIRQVVMNLITNAAEAIGEEKGFITLTTSSRTMNRESLQGFQADSEPSEGPYVALEVADSGSGMDEATIARIFEPFFTTKFTGRGLGMAAVMGIIRGHRGAIRIASEPKKGTRVTVLFPAAAADKTPAIPAVPEILPAPPVSKGRVLLVDDDGALLKTVEILVKDMGFQALTAENGKKALEIFEREHRELSCVLMDLTMPDMDGGEALLEMKRVNSRVRVILASGYSEQVVKDRIRTQDIFAFLQKPYSLEALEGVLQSASRAST
jgi:two-component system cell cycle sensor histidine kinase/response regulator CckA